MEVSEKINNFITYFKKHYARINEVPDPLYTRILWVTAFDTLSVAASPKLKSHNKKRFVSFLVHFAKWNHCEGVSMPQLKLDLDESECLQGKLYERVYRLVFWNSLWPWG